MKTLLITALCAGSVILSGCSKESRDEVIERTTKAAKELNGSERKSKDKDENKPPDIVAEQQRKERVRQNTQWTAENQALHPVEYCQAQLEEVAKYAKSRKICETTWSPSASGCRGAECRKAEDFRNRGADCEFDKVS